MFEFLNSILKEVNSVRAENANELRQEKIKFLSLPLTTTKRTVFNAVFDYAIELAEQRSALKLAVTDFSSRWDSAKSMLKLVNLPDDQFVLRAREQLNTQNLATDSSFRLKALNALDNAEITLNVDRKKFRNKIYLSVLLFVLIGKGINDNPLVYWMLFATICTLFVYPKKINDFSFEPRATFFNRSNYLLELFERSNVDGEFLIYSDPEPAPALAAQAK